MVFIKKKKHKSSIEIESDKQDKALLKAGIVDEFQTKGFETIGFLRKHKTPTFISLAAVLGLTLAIFSWVFYGRVSNEEASDQYSKALAMIANQANAEPNTEQLKAGRNAFLAVATDHPNSSVGQLAVLYAAHISLEIKEYQAAIEEYQLFLKATSKNNSLRPLALSGLAHAFESNNDLGNALQTYEQITKLKLDINAENTYWQIARIAKKQGQFAKAKTNAEILIKNYPLSTLVSQAKILVNSLPQTEAQVK